MRILVFANICFKKLSYLKGKYVPPDRSDIVTEDTEDKCDDDTKEDSDNSTENATNEAEDNTNEQEDADLDLD